MGPDGPTRPHDSTAPRDILDLFLPVTFFPFIARQSNPIPIQTSSRNRRSNARKKKGVRNRFLSRLCDFPEFPLPPSEKSQAQQPDSDPDQLAEPPEQREGDAGHVGVAEGTEQQQISAVLGAKAAGDEEGAAFDKDGEGANRDGGEGHSRTPRYQMMTYTSNASTIQPSRNSPVEAQKAGRKMGQELFSLLPRLTAPFYSPPRSRRKYSTMRLLIRIASGNINVLSKLVCFSLLEWHPC